MIIIKTFFSVKCIKLYKTMQAKKVINEKIQICTVKLFCTVVPENWKWNMRKWSAINSLANYKHNISYQTAWLVNKWC